MKNYNNEIIINEMEKKWLFIYLFRLLPLRIRYLKNTHPSPIFLSISDLCCSQCSRQQRQVAWEHGSSVNCLIIFLQIGHSYNVLSLALKS